MNNTQDREIRTNEIRLANDSRLVEGYAIRFNSPSSDEIGWIETINPNAITEETIKRSDVFCYLDHDRTRGVLARSKNGQGSLELELRDDGLYYRFIAPDTPLGDELLSYLSRGEITSSSFCFSLPPDGTGDRWYRDAQGRKCREITQIYKLYDVSPVFSPAYAATSCVRRKIEELNEIESKLNDLKSEFETL